MLSCDNTKLNADEIKDKMHAQPLKKTCWPIYDAPLCAVEGCGRFPTREVAASHAFSEAEQLYVEGDGTSDAVKGEISDIFKPARSTAKRLGLALNDLFAERVDFLSKYCSKEKLDLVEGDV